MKQYVGIDIGTANIKFVEVEVLKDGYRVARASMVPSPEQSIMSDSKIDLDEMAKTIKKAMHDGGITNKNINVSLHETQVFTRILEMPPLSEKELVQALRWEAERYIPLPLNEVNMDFAIMERENEKKNMNIAVVASPLRLIEKYVEIFRSAGIHIDALENESFALLRVFRDRTNNRMILDLGNATTGIYVFRKETLALSRTVSTGGIALTKSLVSELNIAHQQAEEYKKTYGVDPSQMNGKLVEVLSPLLASLTNEILQSITFFKENYPEDALYEILLTGGGAMMPGLASYLQSKIQIQTGVANPWFAATVPQNVTNSYQKIAPSFTIATGLAIRDLESGDK